MKFLLLFFNSCSMDHQDSFIACNTDQIHDRSSQHYNNRQRHWCVLTNVGQHKILYISTVIQPYHLESTVQVGSFSQYSWLLLQYPAQVSKSILQHLPVGERMGALVGATTGVRSSRRSRQSKGEPFSRKNRIVTITTVQGNVLRRWHHHFQKHQGIYQRYRLQILGV